jgi:hypothetical protein
MFYGPYLIESVEHRIGPGTFETSFKGIRQQMFQFPQITNYLQIITKQLFAEIKDKLVQQSKTENKTATTQNDAVMIVNQNTSTNTTVNNNNICEQALNNVYKSANYIVANQTQTSVSPKDIIDKLKNKFGSGSQQLQLMTFITVYRFSFAGNQFVAFNNNFPGAELSINWGANLNNLLDKTYVCLTNNNNQTSQSMAVFKSVDDMLNFTTLRWGNFSSSLDVSTTDNVVQYLYRYWNTNPKTVEQFNDFKNNQPQIYQEIYNRVEQGIAMYKSLQNVPVSNVKIISLGEFNALQGNDYSYYNLLQTSGKFIVLRIVDPDFNFNKVGVSQFKDSSGNIVTNSCTGTSPQTCTVNGKNPGTYTLNVEYYPDGPLNSKVDLVSPTFTQ